MQVFSENSDGNEIFVATIMAIPDYITETPEKPTVHFEEGHFGNAEAIHSWYYRGENTGWEFVYPKGHAETNAETMPAPAPAAAAPAPTRSAGCPSAPWCKRRSPARTRW